ncbi:MAG: YybH family protein [Candidatus Hodarchaeota archaeon]
MNDFIDEMFEMEAIETEIVASFDQEDHTKVEEEHAQREKKPRWSRRAPLLVGLLCAVLGVLLLTVVFFMRPDVQRPQIVAVRLPIAPTERGEDRTIPGVIRKKGLEEKTLKGAMPGEEKPIVSKSPKSSIVIPRRRLGDKVLIIEGIKIKEGEKIRAVERPFKVKVFRQDIPAGGIKTKERTPRTVSMREEPTARKVRKKSVKEKSLSHPITSGTVELERKKGPTKAIPLKTSELEVKRVGPGRRVEMPEEKRWEKVGVKIAKKDVKEDGTAASLRRAPSALAKPETAISAQKSALQPTQVNHTDDLHDTKGLSEYHAPSDLKDEGISLVHLAIDPSPSSETEHRVVHPKPASLIATEEEVSQFFDDYMERYNHKDISGFLSLFSPDAIQNNRDGFNEIKEIYSDFFGKSQELGYHIQDMTINIYQDAVEVVGHYKVAQKGKRASKVKVWEGDIRWVLVRENGALKIRHLDFRHQKSP